MRSFVVFSILDQSFGIDIENVKRILSSQPLTKMPDEAGHIEGMFQYEDDLLKVVSFRSLIGQQTYVQQLQELFPELQEQHKVWLDALIDSVNKDTEFTKTTDPHACHLGKWIDSFHPDNEETIQIMKKLSFHHQRLHHSAVDVLNLRKTSLDEANQWIEDNVQDVYKSTVSYLSKIEARAEGIALDLQQCLIIEGKDESFFGVNIDKVEDIVHIEEDALHNAAQAQSMGPFMNVEAILEYEDKLITIVKDMNIEGEA